MTSGISAIGGNARNKLIIGSATVRAGRYQPSRNPTGTATRMPRTTPRKTRRVEATISNRRLSCSSRSTNFVATWCGAGINASLTKPLQRTPYQRTIAPSQGASPSKKRLAAPASIQHFHPQYQLKQGHIINRISFTPKIFQFLKTETQFWDRKLQDDLWAQG